MIKNLTCIICPRGCALTVDINGDDVTVKGNACPKGEKYGIDECTNPVRTVTSTVRIGNRIDTMVSVKTETPVAKEEIFTVMEAIRNTTVNAPIKIDDIIIDDICGSRIIATKNVD